jgi:HD superfamily phosphohydrolase
MVSKEDYLKYDDIDVIRLLRTCGGYPTQMMDLIDRRTLFKPFYRTKVAGLEAKTVKELRDRQGDMEKRISRDYGVKDGFLFVDFPESSVSEFKIKVDTEGGLTAIDKISSLARSLEKSDREKLVLHMYADRRFLGKVGSFKPEKYLDFR